MTKNQKKPKLIKTGTENNKTKQQQLYHDKIIQQVLRSLQMKN